MPISRRFWTVWLEPLRNKMRASIAGRQIQRACLVKVAAGCLAVSLCSPLAANDMVRWNSHVVAGWIEPVYLGEAEIRLTAKLDTGAKTSSLSAVELTRLVRQQKPWVAFTIRTSDGRAFRIEQPVIRIARIRRADVGVRERPVISLPVCLAGYREQVEFTLTDRSTMNYPVLIGRAFLANRIIVNSQATFTTAQSCNPGN